MPIYNVGGPVAWGLVVLASAWGLKAGRALASRRSRRSGDDDDVQLDEGAPQPRLRQQLSATAIRMLIETDALPCAVLELLPPAERPSPSSARSGGPQQPHQPLPTSQRIIPPDLAAAVPCLTAGACVRALSSPEAWRTELALAADAAEAAAAALSRGGPSPPSGAPAASGPSSSTSARAYGPSASIGREGLPAGLRSRLQQQQRLTQSLTSSGSGPLQAPHPTSTHPPADPGLHAQASDGAADPALRTSAESRTSGSQASAAAANAAATAAAAASIAASLPYPPSHALLVVLGISERQVAAVTAAAAAAGYSKVATWVGEPGAFAAASLCGPRLPTVSRHGLWLALQLGPDPLFHVPACVLDVRRPDERLAFGAIRGTLNVPADELAAALALPPAEFRARYGVPPPGPRDVVVTVSRAGRRAAWAAQLCLDAGLGRVYVYNEGVYGWRFEDRVRPYRAYELGSPPPDPEPFLLDEPDEAAGLQELHALGMPLREGPRPSRFAIVTPGAGGGGPGPGAGGAGALLQGPGANGPMGRGGPWGAVQS